jgi:hypothetical protein
MKYKTERKIEMGAYIFMFLSFFILMTVLDYATVFEEKGSAAIEDLIKFLILFVVVFSFGLVARWQITEVDTTNTASETIQNKGFLAKIIAKENIYFNGIIKNSFHLFPLYFTILLIKIDLAIIFKAVLFALSIFFYMLVEITFIWNKVFSISKNISPNKSGGYKIFVTYILVPIIIIISTLYFVYTLSNFYMDKFPK